MVPTQQFIRRRGIPAAVGAIVAIAALTLSGCAGPADTAPEESENVSGLPSGLEPQPLKEKTKITINTAAKIENFSALFLAEYLGEFDKENLEVEFTQVSSADAMSGLAQNQIQVMGLAPAAYLYNAVSSGVNVKVVFPGYLNNLGEDGVWVSNEVAEQGAAALKGQTVASAVGPGSSTLLGFAEYLETGGLTVKDVTVQAFPAADVPTALIQGAVAGAWITSPANLAVSKAGVGQFMNGMPKDAGSIGAAYAFGPDLLTERPEVGAAVVRAMARTVQTYLIGDYKADPKMVENLAAALDRTVEEIESTPSLEFDPDLKIRTDLYVDLQELWFQVGDILSYTEAFPAEDVVDTKFLDAVLGN